MAALAQVRRSLDRQPLDIAVAVRRQRDRGSILNDLHPFEAAGADPRRSLKRVAAARGDEDELVVDADFGSQPVVSALAE